MPFLVHPLAAELRCSGPSRSTMPPAGSMAAALGHGHGIAPKCQASVPASKSCPRNPGAREIRKKLGQGGAGEGRAETELGTREGLDTKPRGA